MGNIHPSRNLRRVVQANTRRVLVVGLDGVGKSALVERLSRGDAHRELPPALSARDGARVGVAVTEFTSSEDHKKWQLLDAPGDIASRALWSHAYLGCTGVIFVLSCLDQERLPAAIQELRELAGAPQLAGLPICIAVNKLDGMKDDPLPPITAALSLEQLVCAHPWTVVATSTRTAAGLPTIHKWLATHMKAL